VPETGDRDGHHVGGRRAVVGDRRPGLRVVPDGPDERAARAAHIHSGRLSTTGVDGRQAHVVPAHGQPVGRRQRPFVHVQRESVHCQRVDAVQTGGDAVLMSTAAPHFAAHARTQAHARSTLTYTRASKQAQKNSNNIIVITIIVTQDALALMPLTTAPDSCRIIHYYIRASKSVEPLTDSPTKVIIVMSYNYLNILPANGMFRLTNLVL